MRLSRRWQVGGAAYVLLVTSLTAIATADPDDFVVGAWLAALALTIPILFVLVPAIYVVVPIVWHVTDIDHGGPKWPTTVAYVVLFFGAAVVNVLLAHWISGRLRNRASPPAPPVSATPTA